MSTTPPSKTGPKGRAARPPQTRQDRLKAALKSNVARRKAQTRRRKPADEQDK